MVEYDNEIKLAKQLRDCCDESGKEIDLSKSAQLIHQLGLKYRKRSPDKISLIQCVGLLNAALFRKPVNVLEVRSDLSEACQHILSLSGAAIANADLIKKAKEVKILIDQLRDEVCEMLKSPQAVKIPTNVENEELIKLQENKILIIKFINETVANKYTNIMAGLSEYCESVMGKPPCKYCVAGMGSLARKEVTPYSDFEHIILLEDFETYLELDVEFFRWHSVIFHVIILNLQETIIPSLNIESLNNTEVKGAEWFFDAYTPRGVSFDGMMPHACKFPLGRQKFTENKPWRTELIKPVSKMLKYLSSEENLKNGYHLSDILTKTCFVYGNQELYQQFVDGVQKFSDEKSQNENMEDTKREVKEDLNQFSARFRLSSLKSSSSINIKQVMYRSSTLFVLALGKINNIAANSCFDIIEETANKQVITSKTKHKLSYAVSVACEIRIRTYMLNKSQHDNINLSMEERSKSLEGFLNIVGAASTINYFQIAYCLQCEVAKKLKFTNFHFYSDPSFLNLALCIAFEETDLFLNKSFDERLRTPWKMNVFEFDSCIEKLENEITIATRLRGFSLPYLNETRLESIAEYLRKTDLLDEAMEFFKHLLYIYEKKPRTNETMKSIALTSSNIGNCCALLHHYKNAITYFNKSLQILKSLSVDQRLNSSIVARITKQRSYCSFQLHDHRDVLSGYQRAVQMFQNALPEIEKKRDFAMTLHLIGISLTKLKRHNEALDCHKKALLIYQSESVDEERDCDIARTCISIGYCLSGLHRLDDALHYHNISLRIYQNASVNKDKDRDVARTLNIIGTSLHNLHQYDEALNSHNKSLSIWQSTSLNEDKDRGVAETQSYVGDCLLGMHQSIDALNHYNKSLQIYLNASLNEKEDRDVAKILSNIGVCLGKLNRYDDALSNYKQSLQIYQNVSLNEKNDPDVAKTLSCIRECCEQKEVEDSSVPAVKKSKSVISK